MELHFIGYMIVETPAKLAFDYSPQAVFSWVRPWRRTHRLLMIVAAFMVQHEAELPGPMRVSWVRQRHSWTRSTT